MSIAGVVAPDPTEMRHELDRLQQSIAIQLRRAGIELPDTELSGVADAILTDAVRVALLWLEERDADAAVHGMPPASLGSHAGA
ncbi:MAG: hypothetical protein ACYC3L_12955 [Gemmatimonadaceae bacterium]